MDEKPKRHRFRFRLSTVLILTAIVAWGMACRPYVLTTERIVYLTASDPPPANFEYGFGKSGFMAYAVRDQGFNPQLRWPAIALAAFLAWKAAWAVVERRRRQLAAPE